ncbi:MAG: hypothetical protein FD177_2418 [Desulfovibrionaceae bacterium]|nr:MAG: hypothetical protein FD177_2418 [Desulfovibrionaceae bacterium]
MTLDLEKYAMREGVTPLSAAELNQRFYAVVRRLHELEQLKMDWEAAVTEVQNHGLARVNDAVAPLLEGLRADMEAVIALGQAAQADQAAAVAAMLAAMEAKIAEADLKIVDVEAYVASLGPALADIIETTGNLTKEVVEVDGQRRIRLGVVVPPSVGADLYLSDTYPCLLY